MKNWEIQVLETCKSGYENWNTYCIRSGNNVHIATVGDVDRFFEKDTLIHALLIAAAPDLLEACKEALRSFRLIYDTVDDNKELASLDCWPLTELRVAIAKAEGKSAGIC